MTKNAKMTNKVAAELKKAGIEKGQINDYMVWGVAKLMLGVMKIKWSLDESGIKGKEADKKLAAIVELVSKKSADELHEMLNKNEDCGCESDWKK